VAARSICASGEEAASPIVEAGAEDQVGCKEGPTQSRYLSQCK
jgi:hypothetical protein